MAATPWGILACLVLCSAFARLASAKAQEACMKSTPVSSLSVKAFQGRWFEIATSARLKFGTQIATKCNFVTFTPKNKKSSVLDVTVSGNSSLQYYPWAYDRVDVFTAIAGFSRTICKSLTNVADGAQGSKGGDKLLSYVTTVKQQVSAIALASGALTQGSTKGSSAAKLAKAIKASATNIQSLVKKIDKSLAKGAPLPAALSEAVTNITKAADLAKYVENIKPKFRSGNDWYGTASQNKIAPGIFKVNVTDLAYFTKYNVLALEGDASKKYTAALIYQCTSLVGEGPRYDVVILSRSKTLETSTYNKFVTALEKLDLGCDNPLVPTFQDTGKDCTLKQ